MSPWLKSMEKSEIRSFLTTNGLVEDLDWKFIRTDFHTDVVLSRDAVTHLYNLIEELRGR